MKRRNRQRQTPARPRQRQRQPVDVVKKQTRAEYGFYAFAALVIAGNIAIMGCFALTRVGLTDDEIAMLAMTSSQINQIYADACIALDQVGGIQNYTSELLEYQYTLDALVITQIALNESVTALNASSTAQAVDVLLYNATIESLFTVLQPKIDNTTTPQFNLTLDSTATTISNGTVLLSNPNNRLENTTLVYAVQKFLSNTLVSIGQPGDELDYQTLGAQNWVSLIDWDPPLLMDSANMFSNDQVLDAQRDKITVSPPIGLREYNVGSNELKLIFDGLLLAPQTLAFVEPVSMSVGLL